MVKYFYEESSEAARSLQVWLILIGNAERRETSTYGSIGDRIGTPPVAVGRFLNRIYYYCEENCLPRLSVLVVNQSTGEPGDGYPGSRDSLYADREAVYDYDWISLFPPTLEQLVEAGR